MMAQTHWIGNKLYDLLQHQTNERKEEYSNSRYKTILRIYINKHVFKTRGANLNETNLKNFNIYLEKKIKDRFREMMDDKIEVLPNFMSNLPYVRKKLGIDVEAWDDDSMKKDYYRYRKATGKKTLYKKNFSRHVPSGKFTSTGF